MSEFEENDLLTLDDESKYLILDTLEYEDKKYLLVIGVTKEENIDTDDILFVEEIKENDEYYLEAIDDEDLYKKLIAISLTKECIDTIPGVREAIEKDSI